MCPAYEMLWNPRNRRPSQTIEDDARSWKRSVHEVYVQNILFTTIYNLHVQGCLSEVKSIRMTLYIPSRIVWRIRLNKEHIWLSLFVYNSFSPQFSMTVAQKFHISSGTPNKWKNARNCHWVRRLCLPAEKLHHVVAIRSCRPKNVVTPFIRSHIFNAHIVQAGCGVPRY